MVEKTILTGIRPTGNLHIGHYLGAVRTWKELQEKGFPFFLEIADVQALTDNFHQPEKVRKNVRELTIDILSCGIDPKKTNIFIQSMIPEIAELTVFYSNLVTIPRLYRNPTVKTEIKQKRELFGEDGEGITYGFLGYPVSQAADITAFHGAFIPVGDDQLPLLEQCREIVRKFNKIYGDTLIEPEAILSKTPRIKGLDGNEKMGKSLGNAVFLSDDAETITKKIMAAVTDPKKLKKDDSANPEVCMVYYYHKLVNQDNIKTVCGECQRGTRGCVSCKKELINAMMDFLNPIQERRKYYLEHLREVDQILMEGTKQAQARAKMTMKSVKEHMQIQYFES